MYVRIVEVEAYLDAKSDDTMCMCERKKDTLVRLFGMQKATMAKKKKKRAVKNEAKFCFLSRVGKGFCLADTLFGA